MNFLWETFDKNEISIMILIAIAYTIFFILPFKFKREITWLFMLLGFTIGVFFDFTIGGGLFDFFKLNDTDHYELFDFCYYLIFAPFSYFFIYFYDTFNVNKKTFNFYILLWVIVGVIMQWVFTKLGIVEFQNGYEISYSFAVFLITQTFTALYFELIRSRFRVLKNI
ncbi:hypothetical protein [Halobacillus trueperi]|nr:hypothetical protein [Halobacillus trueperi]